MYTRVEIIDYKSNMEADFEKDDDYWQDSLDNEKNTMGATEQFQLRI